MQSIGQALRGMNIPTLTGLSEMTEKERFKRKIDSFNRSAGDLNEKDGYHCEICNDKGIIMTLSEIDRGTGKEPEYREVMKDCKCQIIRNSIRRLKKSGLEDVIKEKTFDAFEVTEEWQRKIKDAAMIFARGAESRKNNWFFIGGANGAGKSHICTAISRDFLRSGKSVKYMLWVDEVNMLKACMFNDSRYEELIRPLKTVDVLYVDDFFKIVKDKTGTDMPPNGQDIRIAYEILNFRYCNPELITIISSERYISEIIDIDPATGSRIYEKTDGFNFNVERKREKNYRIRNMELL